MSFTIYPLSKSCLPLLLEHPREHPSLPRIEAPPQKMGPVFPGYEDRVDVLLAELVGKILMEGKW